MNALQPADTSVLEKMVALVMRATADAQAFMSRGEDSGITRAGLYTMLTDTGEALDLGYDELRADPALLAVHAQAVEMVATCLQTLGFLRLSEFDVDGATPN